MRKKLFLISLLFCLMFIIVSPACAHQPRLVAEPGIIMVKNPEISQAFYSNLIGQPQLFQLSEKEPFNLYLNILAPDLADSRKDFTVDVFRGKDAVADKMIYSLDGKIFDWVYFYEEYGGDGYFKGPELRQKVEAGDYLIRVSNPQNMGKYSLAIGEIESFPPAEIINTIITLPQIKSQIFNKSPWSALANKIGEFLGIGLVPIIGVIIIVILLVKKVKKVLRKKKN